VKRKKKIDIFAEVYSQLPSSEVARGHNDRTGMCPAGHGIMERARVEVEEDVFYLEKCTACGGIWFDSGEWSKIAEHQLVESLQHFWSRAWQTRQRMNRNRSSYLQKNLEMLGEEVCDLIRRLAALLREHPEQGRALAFLKQEIREKGDLPSSSE